MTVDSLACTRLTFSDLSVVTLNQSLMSVGAARWFDHVSRSRSLAHLSLWRVGRKAQAAAAAAQSAAVSRSESLNKKESKRKKSVRRTRRWLSISAIIDYLRCIHIYCSIYSLIGFVGHCSQRAGVFVFVSSVWVFATASVTAASTYWLPCFSPIAMSWQWQC